MRFILPIKLKKLCLARMAILVYNKFPQELFFRKTSEEDVNILRTAVEFRQFGDEIMSAIEKLELPQHIKEELRTVVLCLCKQEISWDNYYSRSAPWLERKWMVLHWTPYAVFDKRKTEKCIINFCYKIEATLSFRLACTNCLEDRILAMWDKMDRKEFYGKKLNFIAIYESKLVSFWCHFIMDKLDLLSDEIERFCDDEEATPYMYAFQSSALSGNDVATKFFWQKLSITEKQKVLVKTTCDVATRRFNRWKIKLHDFPKQHYVNVLCYLLSQMEEEQVTKVLENHSYEVLICLLDWPWQDLFLEAAKISWCYLSVENFCALLMLINEEILNKYTVYDYAKLFAMFWRESPLGMRQYVMQKCCDDLNLLYTFTKGNKQNGRLILRETTCREQKKLISELDSFNEYLCSKDKWKSFKSFVKCFFER